MQRTIIAAALVSIISAQPAFSKPQTRSEKIAEAKASLESSADEAMIQFWNQHREMMVRFNITMDYHRRFGRWMMVSFSIGQCEAYAKPTLVADWMSKMDAFSAVLGEGFTEIRRSIELAGNRLRSEGRQFGASQNSGGAATEARLCDIELEAVRQLLVGI